MIKEELAEKLHGMEYRTGIPKELLQEAKDSGLLIITGASDDLIELEGALTDEGDCYGGGEFYIGTDGFLVKPDNDYDDSDEDAEEAYFKKFNEYRSLKKKSRCIVAEWCKEEDYSWTYVTGIPHATFDILEDGDKYCRGIVIDIQDLN